MGVGTTKKWLHPTDLKIIGDVLDFDCPFKLDGIRIIVLRSTIEHGLERKDTTEKALNKIWANVLWNILFSNNPSTIEFAFQELLNQINDLIHKKAIQIVSVNNQKEGLVEWE